MTTNGEQNGICLAALDGGNPLAYLAALGTLRTLNLAQPSGRVAMSWQAGGGSWRPSLRRSETTWTRDAILDGLHDSLRAPADYRAFTLAADPEAGSSRWADKLRIPAPTYREFVSAIRDSATAKRRYAADFAACWASEACTLGESIQDTSFQFTAGQQKFLSMVRELIELTSRPDLERSLFEPWTYTDSGPSLRWDPLDEKRQYALQWYDPTNASRNPVVAMRGANRLAVEALPLYPAVPTGTRLRTAGFTRIDRREVFTWPVWTGWLNLDVVVSLVNHPALQEPEPDRSVLGAMGIVEIYRSTVVMPSGRYRCFTPARAA